MYDTTIMTLSSNLEVLSTPLSVAIHARTPIGNFKNILSRHTDGIDVPETIKYAYCPIGGAELSAEDIAQGLVRTNKHTVYSRENFDTWYALKNAEPRTRQPIAEDVVEWMREIVYYTPMHYAALSDNGEYLKAMLQYYKEPGRENIQLYQQLLQLMLMHKVLNSASFHVVSRFMDMTANKIYMPKLLKGMVGLCLEQPAFYQKNSLLLKILRSQWPSKCLHAMFQSKQYCQQDPGFLVLLEKEVSAITPRLLARFDVATEYSLWVYGFFSKKKALFTMLLKSKNCHKVLNSLYYNVDSIVTTCVKFHMFDILLEIVPKCEIATLHFGQHNNGLNSLMAAVVHRDKASFNLLREYGADIDHEPSKIPSCKYSARQLLIEKDLVAEWLGPQ